MRWHEMKSHLALNMFKKLNLIRRTGTSVNVHGYSKWITVGRVDRLLLDVLRGLANMLNWNVGPLLCQFNHCTGVHQTVTKFMWNFPLDPIENPTRFFLKGRRSWCQYHKILHIPPCKWGICLKCQSGNASGNWCRCRCTSMLNGAYMIGSKFPVHINGCNALVITGWPRGIGRGQSRTTFL